MSRALVGLPRGFEARFATRRAAFTTRHSYLVACNEELLARVAAAEGDHREARRRLRLTRRHDPGSRNVEAYLRLAEADLLLLEGEAAGARERLAAADELLDALDDEGLLFRCALRLLLPEASGESARPEGPRALEELRPDFARSSFAFRFEELARRFEESRGRPP